MDRLKRLFFLTTIVTCCAALTACGDDGDGNAKTNNMATTPTNNATTNNMSTSNNSGTNNATTNNATTNNMSTSNNQTTNNNPQGCQPLDPALGACDPICQTGCEEGQSCILGSTGPGAPVMATCVDAGAGGDGATCMSPNDCQVGFLCATTAQGEPGTCRQVCDAAGGEPMCADGSCVRASMEIERLGACSPSCTAFPNDTCDAGQQCYPVDQMGGTVCGGPGSVELGGNCTNLNDCVADAVCAGGTCAALCSTPGAQDSCTDGALCRTLVGDFNVCINSCTPYPNDDCGPTQQCYPTQDGGTACGNFDANAQLGDACQVLNDCNKDQFCANSQCLSLCAVAGDNSDCEGGETCANVPNTDFNVCVSM